MKSIRKSLNSNKDGIRSHISTPIPLPSVSKPPVGILPPLKVIKAIQSYRSNAPQELSFQKGDFFHVLNDVQPGGLYYEAHNPASGARGLVRRDMFEEFNKNTPSLSPQPAPFTPSAFAPSARPNVPTSPKPKTNVYYAVVLHDFEAERADELDAKRGDNIAVVAQSNREWFVAKSITRVGRPGLIPISFVKVHDPATGKTITDIDALMNRGDLPKVEDWKRAMFNYKQNSIALGVIDAPGGNRESVPNSPFAPQTPRSQGNTPYSQTFAAAEQQPTPQAVSQSQMPELLPEGILVSARVKSFHFESDEYWFWVYATFQPYAQEEDQPLPPSKHLTLYRIYDDFRVFQLTLLEMFPKEAGKTPYAERSLPYMPGPASHVDDKLTATRRGELDEYLVRLCELSRSGSAHILESTVVRDFLALKPGDVENEGEPELEALQEIFASEQTPDNVNEVQQSLGQLRINEDHEKSEGSDYEDEGYAASPQRSYERHPYATQQEERRPSNNESNLRLHALQQNHRRTDSNSPAPRAPTHYSSNSRSGSPLQEPRTRSPQPVQTDRPPYPRYTSSQSTQSVTPASNRSSHAASTASGGHSGRSRSQSNATNFNAPAISTANSQTAFVKIKIYDRQSEDLVAIRVHPQVTHAELVEKVQARLGTEVENLKYRDSMNNAFVGLYDDEDLRIWMDSTDKHVLYAN